MRNGIYLQKIKKVKKNRKRREDHTDATASTNALQNENTQKHSLIISRGLTRSQRRWRCKQTKLLSMDIHARCSARMRTRFRGAGFEKTKASLPGAAVCNCKNRRATA